MIAQHSAAFDAWIARARSVPIEDEIKKRGINLKRAGAERIGPCPHCGGADRFAINVAKQVFNCRGCGARGDVIDLVMFLDSCDFVRAGTTLAGEPPAKANGKSHSAEAHEVCTATFTYHDESGTALFMVGRLQYRNPDGSFVLKDDGKPKKSFRQKRPDPDRPGQWIHNVDGVRTVPYRLPELIEAIGMDHLILIVEGEAKVDLLRSWNVPATCNAQGAKKWKPEHSKFLRGADVVILPDNDEPGHEHADAVGASLQGIAKSVRVLELPKLEAKEDIVDWASRDGTVERLHDLIAREARPWAPRTKAGQQQDESRQGIATVGHTGKDESRGERGSNAKLADVDLQVQISGDTTKTATVKKANDQEQGPLTSFRLEPYDFGADEDGDAFRTFVLSEEIIEPLVISGRVLSDKQQLAIDALAEAVLSHGVNLPSANGLKAVTAEQWRDELYRRQVLDRDAKNPRARFAELRTQLARRRLIGVQDESVWLTRSLETQ